MPTAAMLRANDNSFEHIVSGVLNMRHEVKAKRKAVLKIPSIMRAEFTREIEELNVLRGKMHEQVQGENAM